MLKHAFDEEFIEPLFVGLQNGRVDPRLLYNDGPQLEGAVSDRFEKKIPDLIGAFTKLELGFVRGAASTGFYCLLSNPRRSNVSKDHHHDNENRACAVFYVKPGIARFIDEDQHIAAN